MKPVRLPPKKSRPTAFAVGVRAAHAAHGCAIGLDGNGAFETGCEAPEITPKVAAGSGKFFGYTHFSNMRPKMQAKRFNLFGPVPTKDEARQSLTDAFAAFAVARRTMTMVECQDFVARYADDPTSDLGLGGKGFVESFAQIIRDGLAKTVKSETA